jgi:Uma2 family endonuclease
MTMTDLPFDPRWPPESPPPQVRRPLLWRMAARLAADHRPPDADAGERVELMCRCCGAVWPCEPQLLGRRGLLASLEVAPAGEGRRGEVADGRLVLAPPPSRWHEHVVAALIGWLRQVVPEGAVVSTGQPVHLPGGDAPVPDAVVTSARPARPLGPPAVHTVVEVVDADGRFLDRVWKRDRYQAAGIPCYWRVELSPWPGYAGALPVLVVRLREPGGWRETIVAPGRMRAVPVAVGRAAGGEVLTIPVRFDPALLTGQAPTSNGPYQSAEPPSGDRTLP